jgi:predicted transcriptional regulator
MKRRPRTHAIVEDQARKVFELRQLGHTHQRISELLSLTRHTVTYYLSPRCKALFRAGLIK